jgi:hypothetical protein
VFLYILSYVLFIVAGSSVCISRMYSVSYAAVASVCGSNKYFMAHKTWKSVFKKLLDLHILHAMNY